LVDEDPSKKWRSAWVRTYTTFIMMGGFVVLFMLGHMPLMALLVAIQIAMFKEVKRLSKVLSTQQALPSFRPLHWYWFFTAMFFSYGRVLASYFHYAIPYHTFISFALYMIGVVSHRTRVPTPCRRTEGGVTLGSHADSTLCFALPCLPLPRRRVIAGDVRVVPGDRLLSLPV